MVTVPSDLAVPLLSSSSGTRWRWDCQAQQEYEGQHALGSTCLTSLFDQGTAQHQGLRAAPEGMRAAKPYQTA